MQGYDSVVVKADVELGGTDQKFNLLAGRDLQRLYDQEPQSIVLGPIIEGLDGRKMSSSYGNSINLFDTPHNIFGKVMSLHDEFIIKYFEYLTRVSREDVSEFKSRLDKGENPKDIKVELGKAIVRMYHGQKSADEAHATWEATFSQGGFPQGADTASGTSGELLNTILIASGAVSSKTEFRRFLENGAIKEFIGDDFKIITEDREVSSAMQVKIGKKRFLNIEV